MIRFRDASTIEKVFNTTNNLIDSNDYQTEVTNKKGDQLLTMIFHPGDVINSFSEFRAEYNLKHRKTDFRLNKKDFVTGKGIKQWKT